MTSRDPSSFPAQHPASARDAYVDASHWDAMYKALLARLTAYVDAAILQALIDRGLDDAWPRPAAHATESDHDAYRTPGRGFHATAVLPPWLQPFTLPEQVRFTRTPDALLRGERPLPEPLPAPEPRDAAPAFDASAQADDPPWRKPFSLPPNVRINRTPYPKPAEAAVPADAAAPRDASAVEPASEMPPWFGFISPPHPTDVHPADEQDNGAADLAGIATLETSDADDHLADAWMRLPGGWADLGANRDAPGPAIEALFGTVGASAVAAAPVTLLAAAYPAERVAGGTGVADIRTLTPYGWFSVVDVSEVPVEAGGRVALHPAVAIGTAAPAARAAERSTGPEAGPAIPDRAPASAGDGAGVAGEPAGRAAPNGWFALAPEPDEASVPSGEGSGGAGEPVPAAATQPIGIASPDDARAFLGPARSGGGRREPVGSRGAEARRVPHVEVPWEDPPIELLVEPPPASVEVLSSGALEQNARLLEGVLEEFGVRGEIIDVRPGPVVTLYELEPAPGTKSSRVIGLADDIARSMSAISARVAVVQGRNVIGIELPNQRRETVYLREMIASEDFGGSKHKLAIALGKSIGGEPVIVDLARMPHLLVAGTTGSGKSVAINTMILSLLYRLKPEDCRLIMVDPKMLELSIYEGIPHLLTPVVTDPKKAVVALKWAVREMEDRYKKMAKVGVRNIDGFNARVAEAKARDEVITRTVQTGFNRDTGEPIFETEAMDLSKLPYIVVVVDEMADLMMVAGKDIEGAIQRLAQMARAAGIHLIMATQRPSVDVITGTIKANFPTRISFQVTSKIDSRTILGEQGAEQLLGQGDMLYMAGGGRISRVHGPFVSDGEVEGVVAHLKAQGHPAYLDVVVTEEDAADAKAEAADEKAIFDKGAFAAAGGEDDADLYDQAIKVVLRDKKCSTSYIQRRLQVGYNKAASLVERMEKEGIVGQANNAGKREILVYSRDLRFAENREGEAT